MKRVAILILSLLLQTALPAQQGFTFNRISTEDGIGLASNVVYCTYQDPKGFIWVGTANGLQRFDGSKFIQFATDKRNKNSLPVSNLIQILPADSSSLWLAFPNSGQFGIFNTATFAFTAIPVKTSHKIPGGAEYKMWRDSKGEIFISILRFGILHFDKQRKIFTDDNYFGFPPGWTPTHGFFEDTVKNQYWFACSDKGLAVYDAASKQLYTSVNNPRNIPLLNNKKILPATSEVFIDSKRHYWVFNWPGVHVKRCFDSTGRELRDTSGLNMNPDYSELRNFYETRQGLLWMYGTNALYNYDRNEKRFFFYEHGAESATGIQFHYAYQVMEDHDGSIWVATDNGLYFTSPGSGTYSVVDMLFNNREGSVEFTDILELKSGGYWLSTWGRGIFSLSENMVKQKNDVYRNMPRMNGVKWIQYRQTWALYQHRDGKVWIGCQAGNYMVYDTLRHTTRFLSDRAFGGSTINYITGDKKGNLWFATFSGRVVKFDGRKFTLVRELGSLVTKILVDKEGLLWVAAENSGLYCLNAEGTKVLQHYSTEGTDNKLFLNTGRDIEQLNDSIIVFGAGAMNFINKRTGKVHWLTVEEGLPSNTLQRIRIDADGYLWMITLNGLCRYNPATRRITTYGRKDGITLAHLTTEADYFSSSGFVMFTGANGLLYFQPSVFQDKQPQDVVITDFKVFNTYIPVDSLLALPKVQLSSDQNSFSIYFAALSYLQREKLTYYYKMTGIDKDWVKADRSQYVNFSLLPPGNYTFSVYCEDIDGTRSKHITGFHIYIRPPFWRTFWFMSCLLFVIALFIYFIHSLRVKRLLAVEKLRNRVARDLHDDMGSTLSTINILSSMAKSRMGTDPVKTTEYLGKISDNSQRMMDAMDDIVWSIKPSNDSMQKIAARMREFATNVLEAKEIELDFRVTEPVFDVTLNMEARRDFFLVFKEAVNNAAKYSKATMVVVRVGLHHKRLVMLVEDNGIGFDPITADGGNGLGNMQKRADAMKGRVQILSKPGEGTHVTLNIPVQ